MNEKTEMKIVKELESYHKETDYEKIKELNANMFQSLEGIINQNEDYRLINNSYTNKSSLFSFSTARGALDYDIHDDKVKIGKLKLGFSTRSSAESEVGDHYIQLKIQLYVKYCDQKKEYDPKIIDDITTKFKSFEKE